MQKGSLVAIIKAQLKTVNNEIKIGDNTISLIGTCSKCKNNQVKLLSEIYEWEKWITGISIKSALISANKYQRLFIETGLCWSCRGKEKEQKK
jgi:hypothetical protein